MVGFTVCAELHDPCKGLILDPISITQEVLPISGRAVHVSLATHSSTWELLSCFLPL